MKIAVTTLRTLSRDQFVSYCALLREIGVPIKTVGELVRTGRGEWTTHECNGGVGNNAIRSVGGSMTDDIRLTRDEAHTVIAVLDEARLHTSCRSCKTSITHTINLLRDHLGVMPQTTADQVRATALHDAPGALCLCGVGGTPTGLVTGQTRQMKCPKCGGYWYQTTNREQE